MGLFVGRAFIYLIFGFFVYETTKAFNKVFGLSVSPYFGILYVMMIYAFQEFAYKRFKVGDQSFPSAKPMHQRAGKLVPFIAGMIVVSFLIYILAVFVGVIYNEILKAR